MIEEYFADESARKLLSWHGLPDFAALWSLEAGWFEEPNQRRGGWSGVSRYGLANGAVIFVKRQENHVYRSWRNFFRPVATFEREFQNLLRFEKCGIPTMELLYFGHGKVDGCFRAILVTRELTGYRPADAPCYNPIAQLGRDRRNCFIQQVSATIRRLHEHRIQHNCLYPKHVFVREDASGAFDARLIDLEKAKRRYSSRAAAIHDLSTLYRHSHDWSRTDYLRFFLAYRQEKSPSQSSRKMLQSILSRKRYKLK